MNIMSSESRGKSDRVLIAAGLIAILLVLGSYLFLKSKNGVSSNRPEDELNAKYSTSRLLAVSDYFDFGTVSMVAGDVSHVFKLENNGKDPVKIEKVYTSCMCTTAYITDVSGKRYGTFGMPGHGLSSKTDIEVGPSESVLVEAIFDPAAHGPSGVGLARRSIYIETNSAKWPKLELSFQAMVTR
jgi:hypothetical protein